MKLYQATWREDEPTAQNSEWFGNCKNAEKCAKENGGIVKKIEVPTDRVGLLDFLNEKVWRE